MNFISYLQKNAAWLFETVPPSIPPICLHPPICRPTKKQQREAIPQRDESTWPARGQPETAQGSLAAGQLVLL